MKNSLHSITEKIKKFLVPHKIIAGIFVVLVLLLGITFLRSFAYYEKSVPDVIVKSKVGNIPDIEIRIMQADGNAAGGYKQITEVPDTNNYHYNETKSHCANKSTLTFNKESKNFTIEAEGTDLCFAYFDNGETQ